MYNNQINAKDVTLKSVLSGVGLYGLSAAVYGDVGTIRVMGNLIPTFVPLFGTSAVASVASDLGTAYIAPLVPQSDKMKNASSATADFLISGAVGAAALKVATEMPNGHLPQAFILAGVVNGAVEWAYYNIISKSQQGIII